MEENRQVILQNKISPSPKEIGLEDKPGFFSGTLFPFLSRYYVWLLSIIGLVIIVFENSEHLFNKVITDNSYKLFSVEVFFFLFLLGVIGFLIHNLIVLIAEKDRPLLLLRRKHDFALQLSSCQDIQAVSKVLARHIISIFPTGTIDLYVQDQEKDWFIQVYPESGSNNSINEVDGEVNISSKVCRECLLQKRSGAHFLSGCRQVDALGKVKNKEGFCVPLVNGFESIGLLTIYIPGLKSAKPEQIQHVEDLSEELASALARVIEKKNLEEARLAERMRTLRHDLARDLHDTVGQNIGFLRMKLDHLSEKNEEAESDLIVDIRRMSGVANESYDMLRGTLAALQFENSGDLLYLFSKYAEQVADRSNFQISFSSSGEPLPVSVDRLRHIFFIFREAISNIEKHAGATQVTVELNWKDDSFTLVVSDNGKGYDTSRTQKLDIHFGIKFMRERVALLKGTFAIKSGATGGTQVKMTVPC